MRCELKSDNSISVHGDVMEIRTVYRERIIFFKVRTQGNARVQLGDKTSKYNSMEILRLH